MPHLFQFLGSVKIAAPLLVLIAILLAWGTLYETRYGTAAVQRFIYQAVWFQALLGFLAINLAVAALQRYPWKRRHLPFVLAHVGIIGVLIGAVVGGRLGVEGRMIIPEGQASDTLELPGNLLLVHQPNPGLHQAFPTHFETTAWEQEPNVVFSFSSEGRRIDLTVDRYYPNAVVEERILEDETAEQPAVRLLVGEGPFQEEIWLIAADPQRFAARWGRAHLFFLAPKMEAEWDSLLGSSAPDAPRGVVSVRLPGEERSRDIPVPEVLHQPIELSGTPYRLVFKDFFSDFALSDQGPVNRSDQPNNPAVALILEGPEGTDAHLLFAFHPEFAGLHGRANSLGAQLSYRHPAGTGLPADSIAIVQLPQGGLAALLGQEGGRVERIEPLEKGVRYTHVGVELPFVVADHYPHARLHRELVNRGDEVRAEAIHVVGRAGEQSGEAWIRLRQRATLHLGGHPLIVEYRPGERTLPFSVKLLDFRRIDYPGTQMASDFESDVELTDPERGLTLKRKISMNNPLKYRGYSLFQSSYVPGEVETTILSVRNDPGTPLVYGGCLIVVLGVVAMFRLRSHSRPSGAGG